MRRLYVSVLILAALLVTGVMLYDHTISSVEDISARLEAFYSVPERERGSYSADISDRWDDFCAGNIFLMNNEGAAEVSMSLKRITAKLEAGADTAEELRTAVNFLALYERSQRLTFDNIF